MDLPTNSFPLPSTSFCFPIQKSSLLSTPPSISLRRRCRCKLLSLSVPRPRCQFCRSPSLLDRGHHLDLLRWPCCFLSINHFKKKVVRNLSPPSVAMPTPFDYDHSQWGHTFEHPSNELRRLASSRYADASLDPGLVSTSVEFRTSVETAGSTNIVPISRLGESLPLLSVFQYFDHYSFCFDASQFCHEMRLSKRFLDICSVG